MREKIRLAVLFGGRSCEHEVSVSSARSMLSALDPVRYEITLIGIGKDGRWQLARDAERLLAAGVVDGDDLVPVLLDYPGGRGLVPRDPGTAPSVLPPAIDVVFPLLHGPFGEDGTVQGLLELTGLPYVGSGVLGSAVGMDKEMMKRAFRAEGLPQLSYLAVRRTRWEREPDAVRSDAQARLGYPMFVKPANLGSSVGVSRIAGSDDFARAVDEAAGFDEKVVIEAAAVDCREVECAVLGDEAPEASVLGEIVPSGDFYDYAAKYLDDASELIVPARVSEATTARVRGLALDAFRAVDAAGLARVDFFVSRDEEHVYLNEINTMPGFTPISMYPRLWQASGVPYPELVDRLVALALARHRRRQAVRAAL